MPCPLLHLTPFIFSVRAADFGVRRLRRRFGSFVSDSHHLGKHIRPDTSRLSLTPWPFALSSERNTLITCEYYKHHKGEWRWRLVAVNGRIIADSAEGYENESECKKHSDRVKDSADAPVVKKGKLMQEVNGSASR
jgi:uncharacterized protein YegP (UPF0339 family)